MAALCPLTALLCLAAALLTTGAPVNSDHGCPEGWSPFGTRCFKFFGSLVTWTQAEKSCQSRGANLASIHNPEENAFVVDLIKKDNGENQLTWIGGHDGLKENLWMWSDGSVWGYNNWASNQPDNSGGNENFVSLYWPGALEYWNDANETMPLKYICAKDAPPVCT
uniref:C-type lectin domain-containing protein n=1 Tax=Neogobius melanostomus TaxID=47308 RepID=A0A8C6WG73_9GOBI